VAIIVIMETAFTFMIGLLQMKCSAGSFNEISSFWLHTQEENIRSLFHYPIGNYLIHANNIIQNIS